MLNMRRNIYFILMAFAMLAFARPAYSVEDVTWPTYYPSPYGNYRQLSVTETTLLGSAAGNVQLAPAGGRVGVGVAAPSYVFEVRVNSAAGAHTAVFINQVNAAVGVGSYSVANAFGSIQGYTYNLINFGTLVLNPGGSHVGIGANSSNALYPLHVGGLGTIGMTNNAGVENDLKISNGTDGNYYAVFAP